MLDTHDSHEDMERAPVGSAISSGSGETCIIESQVSTSTSKQHDAEPLQLTLQHKQFDLINTGVIKADVDQRERQKYSPYDHPLICSSTWPFLGLVLGSFLPSSSSQNWEIN